MLSPMALKWKNSYAVSFCEEETCDSFVMRMILWCTQPFHFLLGHPQFLVVLVFCEQPVWSVCVCVCAHTHAQSYLTLCDPMDCSWPNSSTIQFSRLENWSRLLFPPPGDLSRSGIELHLLHIGRRILYQLFHWGSSIWSIWIIRLWRKALEVSCPKKHSISEHCWIY